MVAKKGSFNLLYENQRRWAVVTSLLYRTPMSLFLELDTVMTWIKLKGKLQSYL